MKKVIRIEETSAGCPEQYEGELDSGEKFYVRCRFGKAELRVGTTEQWDKWEMPTVSIMNFPEAPLRGEFEAGELKVLFNYAGIECELTPYIDHEKMLASIKKMIERLKNPPKEEPAVREKVMFVTLDEDILRGKIEPAMEDVMREMKRKGQVKPVNLDLDGL